MTGVHAVGVEFARGDGTGGFVRLELRPEEGACWYWAYLVGPATGLVVVRDHEVTLPRRRLEVRADGLWAELVCETPGEHWGLGLEAFGVRLDDPVDALRPGGEVGDRVAVGHDLEWEVGTVHGELLVGRDRLAFEGPGTLDVSDAPTDWWTHRPRRAWPSGNAGSVDPPSAIVPLDSPDGRRAVLSRWLTRDPPGWVEELRVS